MSGSWSIFSPGLYAGSRPIIADVLRPACSDGPAACPVAGQSPCMELPKAPKR